jgi:uncharacterized protein (TIGR03086 family)
MPTTDLGPAADSVAAVLAGISDAQLGDPTPCPKYTVGDLVDHVGGLADAFTAAASKTTNAGTGAAPGDAARLAPDWRATIPAALDDLAAAWREDEAWEGETAAGGIEMPGAVAGLVALEELVVHGWDLARATDQPYVVPDATLELLRGLVADFAPADDPEHPVVNDGTLAFGPAVAVREDAPLLDQVLGLTGRDPAWSPGES